MNAMQKCWQIESAITNLRVSYAPHDEAYEKLKSHIEKALHYNCKSGCGLVGDTGEGKSTLIDKALEEYPRTETEEGSRIPIVYLQLNSEPTTGAILKGLLDAYGIKPNARDTKKDMFHMLKTQITECHTSVIIIDDAHHIATQGRKQMHKVSDDLKVLGDLHLLLIFAGTPELLPLFGFNRELRLRFSNRIYLRPLPRNPASLALIHKTTNDLLALSGSGFQVDIDPEDDENDFWTRVHVATNGNIAYLNILVANAAAEAITKNRKKIDKKDFVAAFKEHIFYDMTADTNPFDKDFSFRVLNKPGEPFEDMEVPA